MSLKDKRIDDDYYIEEGGKDGYYLYLEKNVKEAVLEDFEDIRNLYNSITDNDTIFDIKEKLKIHINLKKRRFGDFERNNKW